MHTTSRRRVVREKATWYAYSTRNSQYFLYRSTRSAIPITRRRLLSNIPQPTAHIPPCPSTPSSSNNMLPSQSSPGATVMALIALSAFSLGALASSLIGSRKTAGRESAGCPPDSDHVSRVSGKMAPLPMTNATTGRMMNLCHICLFIPLGRFHQFTGCASVRRGRDCSHPTPVVGSRFPLHSSTLTLFLASTDSAISGSYLCSI